ncbi:DnaJ-domain-containing protein [Metschnikowia bicuspidata var. bicuspidata NRRL YB-4993]|uniref:DnaJ-domain-containing protein n=1 Tax=Metschnikowia bicuspidata var. bicuspidata NRRL YB-4993 TaxID=869754 RepID=A0A1A0HH68_9ASCO|nr:DnaJ-domain-containing protein [Metschnikowia bicuspidata var. bicuspidata NRRL YB-4993]OBA23524.1 DnaJ-domain-containing protein [Metschnikowia bicuspidata var. bicuspidata NRRL YB-4993]
MIAVRLISMACLLACLVAAGLDPYEVLGVPRDADDRTIKSQYRQLSKQYHPDKNPDPEAHERFLQVGEAYGILDDPQKRENYDKYGDPDGGAGQQGGFNDIFNQFFHGGHAGFGGQRQQRQQRGGDTQVVVRLSLQDFYVGKDLEFSVHMLNICAACSGSGSADSKRKTCGKCSGSGMFTQTVQFGPMIQRVQTPCDQCQGSGSTIANKCQACGGARVQKAPRNYSVFVAPGTPKGHTHVLEGEGDQSPDWVPGNLNIRFVEAEHENWGFRRVGDHLYRTEVLTAQEAGAGGWQREIRMFDDEVVTLRRDKGHAVMDGQVDIIKGHGMPHAHDHDEYGHLYVDYKVLPVGAAALEKDEL